MSSAASIRLATLDDLDGILHMAGETRGAPAWTDQQYAEILAVVGERSTSRVVYVAVSSLQICGFCVASLAADQAELESVVVSAAQRRQGIGRGLCLQALAWASEVGAQQLWLEVRESNAAARALYQTIGFVVTGKRRSYYRHPDEDALLMSAPVEDASHL